MLRVGSLRLQHDVDRAARELALRVENLDANRNVGAVVWHTVAPPAFRSHPVTPVTKALDQTAISSMASTSASGPPLPLRRLTLHASVIATPHVLEFSSEIARTSTSHLVSLPVGQKWT